MLNKKLIYVALSMVCSAAVAGDRGHINMGTYYGFTNRCLYKGTTYTFPQLDYPIIKYVNIDLGYLQASKENINNFYVCSFGLNLKEVIRKYVLKDKEDLSIKAKSLLKINNSNTSWFILEPGIFVAYDFNESITEGGITIDLVNLKF